MSRQWKYVNARASVEHCIQQVTLTTRRMRKVYARRAVALGYQDHIAPCSLVHSFAGRYGLYNSMQAELRAGRVHKCLAYKPMAMRRWVNSQVTQANMFG